MPHLPHRIFAYGTLKVGQPNYHHLVEGKHGRSKFIGTGITELAYPLIIATHWNLPFLLYAPGKGHRVVGEIYDIDNDLLAWMDDFEGHPDVYHRNMVKVNVLSLESSSECEIHHDKIESVCKSFKDQLCIEEPSISCRNELIKLPPCETVIANGFSKRQPHSNDIVTNGSLRDHSDDSSKSKISSKDQQSHPVNMSCWSYFLEKFPEGLLSKESYSNYDSKGSHNKHYLPENDLSGPDTIDEALRVDCGERTCVYSSQSTMNTPCSL